MNSRLNINDLQKDVYLRQMKNAEVYSKILELVHKKIIMTNDRTMDFHCFYTLPNYIYGFPLFNLQKCMEYLLTKLINNGFYVQLIHGTNTIFISWRPPVQQALSSY
jgi:hypothetical protein